MQVKSPTPPARDLTVCLSSGTYLVSEFAPDHIAQLLIENDGEIGLVIERLIADDLSPKQVLEELEVMQAEPWVEFHNGGYPLSAYPPGYVDYLLAEERLKDDWAVAEYLFENGVLPDEAPHQVISLNRHGFLARNGKQARTFFIGQAHVDELWLDADGKFRHENSDVSEEWNWCVDHAKGDWIVHMEPVDHDRNNLFVCFALPDDEEAYVAHCVAEDGE